MGVASGRFCSISGNVAAGAMAEERGLWPRSGGRGGGGREGHVTRAAGMEAPPPVTSPIDAPRVLVRSGHGSPLPRRLGIFEPPQRISRRISGNDQESPRNDLREFSASLKHLQKSSRIVKNHEKSLKNPSRIPKNPPESSRMAQHSQASQRIPKNLKESSRIPKKSSKNLPATQRILKNPEASSNIS